MDKGEKSDRERSIREAEKQELSKVMGRYGIQWKQLGTHHKHLSVLDFEKQERFVKFLL